MIYSYTGIETHLDFGFGVTAEAYFERAKALKDIDKDALSATQQLHLPPMFLARHSIELYLKSLIIIFHKKLKIDYGEERFDSLKPVICINDKWKPLFTLHWIDELYSYWLNHLLIPNQDKLYQIAPRGDWREVAKIHELFNYISKYDKDSSYFRYPITKNTQRDHEKYTMREVDPRKFFGGDTEDKDEPKKVILAIINDDREIVSAYEKNDDVLSDLLDNLLEVADFLHNTHFMSRMTLCGKY